MSENKYCQDCTKEISSNYKKPKFCDGCRARHRAKPRKYTFTGQMDEAIKKAYHERADKRLSEIPGLSDLAQKWNIPKHALKRRAGELGLTREKDPFWKEKELTILKKFAYLPLGAIAKKTREKRL